MDPASFDIIVVGGGGSGLAAAVSAAEHGALVLLLEKQPHLGGATGIAVGSFTANSTRLQRLAGVNDSPVDHAEDAGRFAPSEIEARNNTAMRAWFLALSADTLSWLEGMGLQFLGPNPEPPNRVPRMHNVTPGAKAYIAVLQARLSELGGQIRAGAPVIGLLRRPDGGVAGVRARLDGREVELVARSGVILAAGDYAASPELIARFKGERFRQIEGINPHSGGDGHVLAEGAGAQLINMDITYGPELRFIAPPGRTFQQLLPARGPLARLAGKIAPRLPRPLLAALTRRLLVTWQHPENALFTEGAILVNHRGERFCDERQSPEREIALANQPGKEGFILLDGRLIERFSAWPHFISTAPQIAYAYCRDYLRLRPDVAVQAADLPSIATRRGLPAESLERTVGDVNLARAASPGSLPPLTEGPWLLLGPTRAYFTTTEGGAAINRRFQVLDAAGRPIPGLYAVGQVGLSGMVLWGHGLHIAWAITSGRLAGELLAQANE